MCTQPACTIARSLGHALKISRRIMHETSSTLWLLSQYHSFVENHWVEQNMSTNRVRDESQDVAANPVHLQNIANRDGCGRYCSLGEGSCDCSLPSTHGPIETLLLLIIVVLGDRDDRVRNGLTEVMNFHWRLPEINKCHHYR